MSGILSAVLAAAAIIVVILSWHPSANPEIIGFSLLRLSAIALTCLVAVYFTISVFVRKFALFNNYILFCVIAGSVIVEIYLRAVPDSIPDEFLRLLPYEAGQKLAAERGIFTLNRLRGDGISFTWKPGISFEKLPWLKIDKNGFQNDVDLGRKSDVVLIGASVIAATLTEDTFADLFRRDGISAYTLALGGPFGPQQFLAAYKKLVIDRNVAHKFVFVLVTMPNAILKAFATQRVLTQGGNYRNLFGGGLVTSRWQYMPWIISIYNNLPLMLGPSISQLFMASDDPTVSVTVRYGTIRLKESQFKPPSVDNGWPSFERSIGAIMKLAKNAGASPVLLHYPITPLLVLPHVKGHGAAVAEMSAYYRQTTDRLRRLATDQGARFFDITPHLQDAIPERQLMRKLGEYHLNQKGIEFVYQLLKKITE